MAKMTLKMLRAKFNMTQKEAAEKIGVSKDTWGNWERFKTTPDVEQAYQIAEVFDVALDEIIFLPNIAV